MSILRTMAAAMALSLVGAGIAAAADYPNRPIKLIVPYAAGGGTDMVARLVGANLSKQLGQQIIVENKPGAAGTLAVQHVLNQPSDGYTLYFGSTGEFTINPYFFKNLPYDPERDLSPLTLVAEVDYVIAVPASSPAKTLADLVALATSQPGALNYGNPAVGSPHHLTTELFKVMTGTDLKVVTYQKTRQAVTDLIAGRLDVMFIGLPPALKLIKAGRLRPLATAGRQRSRFLPDVATVAELVPGFQSNAWWGIAVKKGTDAGIEKMVTGATRAAVKTPSVVDRLTKIGIQIRGTSTEEFKAQIKADAAKWKKMVATLGISSG